MGQVYFLNHNLSQAEYYFRKALKKDKQYNDAIYGLSETYFYQQKYSDALNVAKDGNDDLTKIQQARILLAQEKAESALDIINPLALNNQLANYYKGEILIYKNDLSGAAPIILYIPTRSEEERGMLPKLPLFDQLEHVLAAGISHLNKISSPATRKVIFSEMLNQTEDPEIALPILKKITETDSTYRDAFVFLGHSYILLNNFEKAKDALLKAKEIDPINSLTWEYLNQAYQGLGQDDMAKTCADKAEKLK